METLLKFPINAWDKQKKTYRNVEFIVEKQEPDNCKNLLTFAGKDKSYWFTNYNPRTKEWLNGGWYNHDFGFVNSSVNQEENVDGVVYKGEVYLLKNIIDKINLRFSTIRYKDKLCKLEIGYYGNDRKALSLLSKGDNAHYIQLTLDLPHFPTKNKNIVFFKKEFDDVLADLIEHDIVSKPKVEFINNFTTLKICEILI